MRSRLAAAAVLLAVLAACARRTDGRVADPDAPPKAAFEVYPAEQIAGVADPHAYRGKALCQRCHRPDLKLTNAPNDLCQECHRFGHRSHPVDVVQRTAVSGLPLREGGKLACHTCHDPHQKRPVLRKGSQLCASCHRRH